MSEEEFKARTARLHSSQQGTDATIDRLGTSLGFSPFSSAAVSRDEKPRPLFVIHGELSPSRIPAGKLLYGRVLNRLVVGPDGSPAIVVLDEHQGPLSSVRVMGMARQSGTAGRLTFELTKILARVGRAIPVQATVLDSAGAYGLEAQVFSGKPLYRVTRLGTAVALESGASAISQPRNLTLATLQHDAVVTSVRLRLEELWNAKFVCERAIKGKEYREVPDGIFFFPSGRGIAIEVENSDKGRTRFLRLLQRWKDAPQITFVLYVATSRELYEAIKRFLEHAPKERPMGVVLWQELEAGKPTVWSQRGDLALFDRREF